VRVAARISSTRSGIDRPRRAGIMSIVDPRNDWSNRIDGVNPSDANSRAELFGCDTWNPATRASASALIETDDMAPDPRACEPVACPPALVRSVQVPFFTSSVTIVPAPMLRLVTVVHGAAPSGEKNAVTVRPVFTRKRTVRAPYPTFTTDTPECVGGTTSVTCKGSAVGALRRGT